MAQVKEVFMGNQNVVIYTRTESSGNSVTFEEQQEDLREFLQGTNSESSQLSK